MTDNDLITLAEREAQRLTDENDHGAAVIMRALMERMRQQRDMLRPMTSPFLSPGTGQMWTACRQCGKEIGSGPMGYVCPRTDCPSNVRSG